MDVGFIGLGRMGQGMASSLLRAGHRVTVYNRTRSRAEALVAAGGAQVATELAGACRGDALITMLADDAALESAMDGIASRLRPGSLHISMETISVALSDRLAEMHTAGGRSYVAAPVIGRPQAAAGAKLFILAAGAPAAIKRAQPLFDAMGQKTYPLGEKASAAHLAKLGVNFLLAAMVEALGEAFALIRKSGLSPDVFLDLITSTIFTAPVYKLYGELIAGEHYEPAGFPVPLGLKDVRLVLAAGDARNVPMPLASLVRDHLLEALALGQENQDWSSVARVSAKNAGL